MPREVSKCVEEFCVFGKEEAVRERLSGVARGELDGATAAGVGVADVEGSKGLDCTESGVKAGVVEGRGSRLVSLEKSEAKYRSGL